MNHTQFYVALFVGNRDDGVMPLMFSSLLGNRRGGSKPVTVVCSCTDRRSAAGAAASFGPDGADVIGRHLACTLRSV
jgi:hypothetical protein